MKSKKAKEFLFQWKHENANKEAMYLNDVLRMVYILEKESMYSEDDCMKSFCNYRCDKDICRAVPDDRCDAYKLFLSALKSLKQ